MSLKADKETVADYCSVADVLYCDNIRCKANEENRCMAMVGDCTIYIKPKATTA